MAVYNKSGNIIGELGGTVQIEALKALHPTYDDDQLLAAAIAEAVQQGPATKIVWDGSAIHFSGTVKHSVGGIGGIDFGGSTIYMPNYDGGIILEANPTDAASVTAQASEISADGVTNTSLMGKVFSMNSSSAGNADMCLGNRMPASSYNNMVVYYSPTVMTMPDGHFATGELYLTPTSGTVSCYNVHSYPAVTFELCNATIVSHSGTNMSLLFRCRRSNTHVHDMVLQGRSGVTAYHNGVLMASECVDFRLDHIYGINPIVHSNTSGYFVNLSQMTNTHISDIYVGDGVSWGSIGSNHLCNTTFERCHLNRWDCHYAQYGHNVIRECVLNEIAYGIGFGVIDVDDCTLMCNETSDDTVSMINLRGDMVGVYAGDIIIRNTRFERGQQPANKFRVWTDSSGYARPSNSKAEVAPTCGRYLINCQLPDGIAQIIQTGTSVTADQAAYANLSYVLCYMDFTCTTVIDALLSAQAVGEVVLDGCRFSATKVTDKVTACVLALMDCETSGNVRVTQNTGLVRLDGCRFATLVSDSTSSYLAMTGCKVSGEQSFAQFANYAAYGNVSSRGTQYTAALNVSV